jgi:hypothetical protein
VPCSSNASTARLLDDLTFDAWVECCFRRDDDTWWNVNKDHLRLRRVLQSAQPKWKDMNPTEAREILTEQLQRFHEKPWWQLVHLVDAVLTEEITAPSGTTYQLEIQAFWDDQPGGAIRVIGSIDDSGLRAFFPLCDDFIKAPDG